MVAKTPIRHSRLGRLALASLWLFVHGDSAAEEVAGERAPQTEQKSVLNLDSPTFGGMQFWTDQLVFHEWRIQRHAVSGHCRLLDDKNVRRKWGSFEDCVQDLEKSKQQLQLPPLKPRVVLVLHGLIRSRDSMDGLCNYLREQGDFTVLNVSYASTRGELADHAAALAKIVEGLKGVREINFVAHSLGNLVVRHYLSDRAQRLGTDSGKVRIGRVVMLAPPNNGAEMARRFQDNAIFQTVWGASGKELATKWVDLEKHLAVPSGEFGIIAGGRGNNDGRSPLIAGDDDFVVGVEETRLPGATDFLVLPVLHGSIMADSKVQECTLRFLESGFFVSSESRRSIPHSQGPHD